ncbi:MAG TPA: universal stress protein [Usitatibacter sp.]|nr:universal stress protein [Usitatibacter sp.]
MYRRILVPVDGSATANRGLREAVRLAQDQGAKLRLVHVVDEGAALGVAEAGVDVEGLVEALVKNGRAVLERARRSAEKLGARPETAIYETMAGPASESILREARKWRADLIVMGTHGRRGLRRIVLGSDAEHVLRETPVPVLFVRAR